MWLVGMLIESSELLRTRHLQESQCQQVVELMLPLVGSYSFSGGSDSETEEIVYFVMDEVGSRYLLSLIRLRSVFHSVY
jgi:hypothetical protein